MEKREKAAKIYIVILFGILNLVCFDYMLLGINIRTILLSAVTVVMFLYHFCLCIRHFKWNKLTRTDWIISVIIVLALGNLIYRVSTGSMDIAQELLVLSMGLIYFILRGLTLRVSTIFGVFSISNSIVYIVLMVTYFAKGWGVPAVQFLTSSGGMTAWLVLNVSVSILAYCVSEEKKQGIFYGIVMVLGSFFLFMQKNMVSILIIDGLLIVLPFVMKPSKSFIKRVMEMFFAYNFLLCNMSLITGYVELFKGYVTYDLEVSVYLELALALAGLGFFTLWDKYTNENDAQDKLLPELLPFFKAVVVVIAIFIGALFAAATRGSSIILPDMMYKLLSLFILSISGQFGIFYTIGQRYGVVGAAVVLIFFAIIIVSCLKKSEEDTEEQKLLKCIAAVYVAQGIFLRQTVVTAPLYIVFVILYMRTAVDIKAAVGQNISASQEIDADEEETEDQEESVNQEEIADQEETANREETANQETTAKLERNITDEVDNTDTMLQ